MILEVVRLKARNGHEKSFEDGIEASLPLFKAAPGCHGISVVRSIEQPDVFYCLVKWETVEAHTEMFQKSPAYEQLFAHIGASIDGDVDATHCHYVVESSAN